VDKIKEEAKLNEIKNMEFPTLNETYNVDWIAKKEEVKEKEQPQG